MHYLAAPFSSALNHITDSTLTKEPDSKLENLVKNIDQYSAFTAKNDLVGLIRNLDTETHKKVYREIETYLDASEETYSASLQSLKSALTTLCESQKGLLSKTKDKLERLINDKISSGPQALAQAIDLLSTNNGSAEINLELRELLRHVEPKTSTINQVIEKLESGEDISHRQLLLHLQRHQHDLSGEAINALDRTARITRLLTIDIFQNLKETLFHRGDLAFSEIEWITSCIREQILLGFEGLTETLTERIDSILISVQEKNIQEASLQQLILKIRTDLLTINSVQKLRELEENLSKVQKHLKSPGIINQFIDVSLAAVSSFIRPDTSRSKKTSILIKELDETKRPSSLKFIEGVYCKSDQNLNLQGVRTALKSKEDSLRLNTKPQINEKDFFIRRIFKNQALLFHNWSWNFLDDQLENFIKNAEDYFRSYCLNSFLPIEHTPLENLTTTLIKFERDLKLYKSHNKSLRRQEYLKKARKLECRTFIQQCKFGFSIAHIPAKLLFKDFRIEFFIENYLEKVQIKSFDTNLKQITHLFLIPLNFVIRSFLIYLTRFLVAFMPIEKMAEQILDKLITYENLLKIYKTLLTQAISNLDNLLNQPIKPKKGSSGDRVNIHVTKELAASLTNAISQNIDIDLSKLNSSLAFPITKEIVLNGVAENISLVWDELFCVESMQQIVDSLQKKLEEQNPSPSHQINNENSVADLHNQLSSRIAAILLQFRTKHAIVAKKWAEVQEITLQIKNEDDLFMTTLERLKILLKNDCSSGEPLIAEKNRIFLEEKIRNLDRTYEECIHEANYGKLQDELDALQRSIIEIGCNFEPMVLFPHHVKFLITSSLEKGLPIFQQLMTDEEFIKRVLIDQIFS